MNEIYESNWKASTEHACHYKHILAFKNGKVFVAVCTRTNELRFMRLPLMRGTTMELEFNAGAIPSDEVEQRQKVVDWLNSN